MARTNIKLAAENKTGSALILYTRDSPDSPAFDSNPQPICSARALWLLSCWAGRGRAEAKYAGARSAL
jgi:hypothetical protein